MKLIVALASLIAKLFTPKPQYVTLKRTPTITHVQSGGLGYPPYHDRGGNRL